MSRVIVRFQSLALREEKNVSVIHFDVEDEVAIHHCRARVEERADGAVEVGRVEGARSGVDHARLAKEVERVYREQVAMVAKLASVVPVESCIVALRGELVMEERVAAAG